jgi:two-component system cell cycle sensor histidine kinase/response regulator CckA
MKSIDDAGQKCWMLVDDNEDILMMMSSLFENLTGARVECHNSPESALAAFRATPAAYELVVTDYEMLGMTGIELCHRMKSWNHDQKIILATGSGYFTKEGAQAAGFNALLRKPFPLSDLVTALADAGVSEEMLFSA